MNAGNGKPAERNPSADGAFDEAVAACINRLEAGHSVDVIWLKQNYPQWHQELGEFVADWGAIEGYSNQLRHVSDAVRLPSAESLPLLDDYTHIQEVAAGGMGVIYKARQVSLSRTVAIKMLHNLRHDRKRFEMEAESAARLDHPNIVSIYEVGEHRGQPYFTMPFIEGSDLSSQIQDAELTPRRAATIAAKIASAVHYAHQRGILHRDLKPGNILVDLYGEPHVTDFGLAKDLDGSEQLTKTNAIIGTPGYMAPEQALGNSAEVSVATDVYGVGAILYAMLSGEAPFRGTSSMEVLRQVVDAVPPSLSPSNTPIDLNVICRKCLSKKPADRYDSAADVADDLHSFLAGRPITARPLGRLGSVIRWARRNPTIALLSLAACAMLLFGLVSLAMLLRSESSGRKVAEQGQARERELNARIQHTLRRENAARKRAELTLNDAYVNYGYASQKQDRPTEALLWFCKAGVESPQERIEANRQRIAAWVDRTPRPVFADLLPSAREASFDVSDRWILGAPEFVGPFSVFDIHTGERLPIEFSDRSTAVAWGTKPGRLWFGDAKGNLRCFDCERDKLDLVTTVDEPIIAVAESEDGASVAIGFGNHVVIYDRKTGAQRKTVWETRAQVFQVQFCCNNSRVIASCEDKVAYVVETSKQNEAVKKPTKEFPFDAHFRVGVTVEKKQPVYPTVFDDNKLTMLKFGEKEVNTRLETWNIETGMKIGSCFLGVTYSCSKPGPQGKIVNGGEQYGRVRTLDNRSHVEIIRHGNLVTRSAICPDASFVATAGWEQTVRLTEMTNTRDLYGDVDDAKPSFAVLPHQTRVSHIGFSHDGQLMTTVQFDGLIRVWDVSPAVPRQRKLIVSSGGNRAEFVPGPNPCLFKGMHHQDGQVTSLLSLDSKSEGLRQLISDVNGKLRDVAVSSDGRHYALAIATSNTGTGFVRVVSSSDPTRPGQTIELPADPRSIAADPTRHAFAVLCGNGETVIIDGKTNALANRYAVPDTELETGKYPRHNGLIAYSPDGRFIVQTGSVASSTVHVFNADDYSERFPAVQNEGKVVQQLQFSPDGGVLAIAGGRSNSVRFVDLDTGEAAAAVIHHPSVVFSARFSSDGRYVVTGCRDAQARVFHWRTGQVVIRGLEHDREVWNACFADGIDSVVTMGIDKVAKIWDMATGLQRCPPIYVGDGMRYLDVSEDSQQAVISGRIPRVVMLDLKQAQLPPSSSMSDLFLFAEVVSNTSIVNTGTVRLSSTEWIERWRRYRRTDLYKSLTP